MKKSIKDIFTEASDLFKENKEAIIEEITSRAYKFSHSNNRIKSGVWTPKTCDCIYEAEVEQDDDEMMDINVAVKLVPIFICTVCRSDRFSRDSMLLTELIKLLDSGDLEIETQETIRKIQKGFVMPPKDKTFWQKLFSTPDFWAGAFISAFVFFMVKVLKWLI